MDAYEPTAQVGAPRPPHPVVAAARALVPTVVAASDEIEATGRLDGALVDSLTAAGLNHLFLPRSAGGPEVDPVNAMAAIEVLATADASVAWCAHVSSANAWQIATLSPTAVAAMAAHAGPPRRFCGSNRPCATARAVEGGYLVNGQWDFASNCLHADWYCGTCVVDEGGRRRTRPLFLPIADGTIIDTWRVAGLRGTGSHDFAVADVFVPAERAATGRHLAAQTGALYHPRLPMVVNWALTAGVALGIAQGALDDFSRLASGATAGSQVALRDRAAAQAAAGRAAATLGAARAYCYTTITAVWEAATAGPSTREPAGHLDPGPGLSTRELAGDLDRLIPPARLAIVHAMQAAVEVVDRLFHAGGTTAVFARHGLERRFRDAHVALQHGAGAPSHFEAGGRLALGLPAGAPLW